MTLTPQGGEGNDEELPVESKASPPSNERLLCTAFISFCTFAIVQTIAAIYAGSEAMVGDSAAMMVDALTYLFNWYAERQKQAYAEKLQDGTTAGKSNLLLYRKYTLQLELVPPLLSVSTLVVVTIVVLQKAIRVLILDAKRDVSKQADPNVHLMMLFSVLNLLLDVLNVFCFARAKHALGYDTIPADDESELDRQQVTTMRSLLSEDDEINDDDDDNEENDTEKMLEDHNNTQETITEEQPNIANFEIEEDDHAEEHHDGSNLNMCSAYTHVFADTLRSIAVILASILAEFSPSITSEEADASAAVVVSILIALSLIPLFTGMVQTARSLQRVNALLEEEALTGDEYRGGD